jgi:hypothetical protein
MTLPEVDSINSGQALTMRHTILRGGLVLDIAAGTAEPADILIDGVTIREIGPPSSIPR